MSLLIVCGQLDVRAISPHALPRSPNHGFEPQQQSVSKPVKDSRADRIIKMGRNGLCFGLRSQVRFLFPITTILRSFLHIHGAPPRANHLKWEIARRGWAAADS
jgi:hypothetical protein